jgi:predicted RNA-binding protein
MCELKAYLRKSDKDKEELILDAVSNIRTEGDEVIMRNLFGEEKRVRAALREVSLSKNRIILEQP